MLIVTNRNFDATEGDHNMFGNRFNEEGPDELRLASATKKADGTWLLAILPEPDGDEVAAGNAIWPSEGKFLKLQVCGRNCVFFLHGFNQTFKKNLEKAWRIQELYDVEVIVFSCRNVGVDIRPHLIRVM